MNKKLAKYSYFCMSQKVKKSPTDKVYPFLLPFQFSVFSSSHVIYGNIIKFILFFCVIKWNLFPLSFNFSSSFGLQIGLAIFYQVFQKFLFLFRFYEQKFCLLLKNNCKLEITNISFYLKALVLWMFDNCFYKLSNITLANKKSLNSIFQK